MTTSPKPQVLRGQDAWPLILWLRDERSIDPAMVGAKAARLAELSRIGLDSPDGFCLTTYAFSRFARDSDPSITQPFREEIDAAIGRLGKMYPGARFAVRSSAVGEDSAGASFAGQHLSVIGVAADDIEEAIEAVWRSLGSDAAVEYARRAQAEQRLPRGARAMGVIVQPVLDCEASGVAFSKDPMTGEDEIIVEAVWGLGEALASGAVTPDLYRVSASDLLEIEARVADKPTERRVIGSSTLLLEIRATTGTIDRPVAEVRRLARALSKEAVREVAALALSLERYFAEPQDIEWGISNGRVYLFQSRPITTLPPSDLTAPNLSHDGLDFTRKSSYVDPIEAFRTEHPQTNLAPRSVYNDGSSSRDCTVWTGGFLEERFPEPLSPLGWSLIGPAFERFALLQPLKYLGAGPKGTGRDQTPTLTRLYKGHPYARVEVFSRLYRLFPDWLLPEDAWRYFPDGDTSLRKRATAPRSFLSPRLWLSLARGLIASWPNPSPFHNHRVWDKFLDEFDRAMEELSHYPADAPSEPADVNGQLDSIERRLDDLNDRLLAIHRWSLTHADILYSLVGRVLRLIVGRDEAERIRAGLFTDLGDMSTKMISELRSIAARVAADPNLLAAFESQLINEEVGANLLTLSSDSERQKDGQTIEDRLRCFIANYGHRADSLDILHPPLRSDPARLVGLIVGLARGGSDRRGRDRQAERSTLAEIRLRFFRSPKGVIAWVGFSRLIELTRTYLRLREDERFFWQKALAHYRQLFGRMAFGIAHNGFPLGNDYLFLRREELKQLFAARDESPLSDEQRAEWEAKVRQRKSEHSRLLAEYRASPRSSYPRFLAGDRPLPAGAQWKRTKEESPDDGNFSDRLVGHPASPGVVTGRARVVLSPSELADLRTGEILVTSAADPGWTPYFELVSALVMETGGQLSHASVVAREYRIPAVVGLSGATSLIKTGDQIEVNGTRGIVRCLNT